MNKEKEKENKAIGAAAAIAGGLIGIIFVVIYCVMLLFS